MKIVKRNRQVEEFTYEKIKKAIIAAFSSLDLSISEHELSVICELIAANLVDEECVDVETVQDLVEASLMKRGHYKVAKAYILYRTRRTECREVLNKFRQTIRDEELIGLLRHIQDQYVASAYDLNALYSKYRSFYKAKANPLRTLVKAAVELITPEAPNWEFIASRLLNKELEIEIDEAEHLLGLNSLYSKITINYN